MIRISNELEIEVLDVEVEIDVEVDYRCYVSDDIAFYPMKMVFGSDK